MPDVRAPSSLRKLVLQTSTQAVEFYRYVFGYFALALLAGAVTIVSIPDLRAQVLAVHEAVVAAADTTEAAPATSKVVAAARASEESAGTVIAKAKPVVLAHLPANSVEALHEYISKKYRVPSSAVRALVETAWDVGGNKKLDPLLLLAVMAIESSFNPFAESHVGAQGLMQVMTRIHRKKFEPYGGARAAWRPDANIAVGAQILQDCIARRGSVPGGLTCYVGSPGTASAYGRKVLAERGRLEAAMDLQDKGMKGGVLVAVNMPASGKPAAKPATTKASAPVSAPAKSAAAKAASTKASAVKTPSAVDEPELAAPVATLTEVSAEPSSVDAVEAVQTDADQPVISRFTETITERIALNEAWADDAREL